MTVMMMMMSSSARACHPTGVTLLLLLTLLMFPSTSDGSLVLWKMGRGVVGMKGMKMRVGSRPPRCVNKCLTCRPCTATLVISQHHTQQNDEHYKAKSREESYYLLSWKCKCGDKLFQP